ncbi:hypothetical protein [Enterobacter cloacae complex sp. 301C7]|uniref:hypothetical protein n=1 Tax=Enterobacter cloacae complex sp. 301C7 TaxID=3395848 RepID=UPI003CE79066
MLTMALIISHTGRRPLQVTQMKITDILKVSKEDGEIYYLLNIPRIKQGLGLEKLERSESPKIYMNWFVNKPKILWQCCLNLWVDNLLLKRVKMCHFLFQKIKSD